jgi:lipopolysaccharide export system protein LptA
MEDQSWKSIIYAAGASIILLLLTYITVTAKTMDFLNVGPPLHIIEFKNAHVIGREKQKKVWEMVAASGWSTKNQNETGLAGIRQGWIYKDNIPIIKNLSAESVSISKPKDEVEAFGSPLKAQIDISRAISSKKRKKLKYAALSAGHLKYFGRSKTSEITKDLSLIDGKTTIYANTMLVDHNTKTAKISNHVQVTRGKIFLFCDELLADAEREEYRAQKNISMLLIEKRERNKISADVVVIKKENDKDIIEMTGHVKIIQAKKVAVADHAIYDEEKNELRLQGSVRAVFEKGEEFLELKTVKNIDNKESRQLLKEKTVLTCDRLIIYVDSDDAQASGHVYTTQNTNEAKSDQALFKDKEENIYMEGNVSLKKENKWVAADKVIVSIQHESFEAAGSVSSKFILTH